MMFSMKSTLAVITKRHSIYHIFEFTDAAGAMNNAVVFCAALDNPLTSFYGSLPTSLAPVAARQMAVCIQWRGTLISGILPHRNTYEYSAWPLLQHLHNLQRTKSRHDVQRRRPRHEPPVFHRHISTPRPISRHGNRSVPSKQRASVCRSRHIRYFHRYARGCKVEQPPTLVQRGEQG